MNGGTRLFLHARPGSPAAGDPVASPGGPPPPARRPRPPAILGLPLDRTTSYRSGTALGPAAVRAASWSLETFSPFLGGDLADQVLHDFGDVALDETLSLDAELALIEAAVSDLYRRGFLPVLIGGEHLVTLPAYRAVASVELEVAATVEPRPGAAFSGEAGGTPAAPATSGVGDPRPVLFHYDAHADLRDRYGDLRLSHATVIRRVAELAGARNVYQFGIRSGEREEMRWAASNVNLVGGPLVEATRAALRAAAGRKVYVTLDIDILDPSHAPGTGSPEPGGPTAAEVFEVVATLGSAASLGAAGGGIDLLAFDLVEVSPPLDPSGRTPVVAAKILRELLIARSA